MSNDEKFVPNIYDRIWHLQTMANKMVEDGARKPEALSAVLLSITGDLNKDLPDHAYDKLLKLWYRVYDMIEKELYDPEKIAKILQNFVDEKP